jgi:hypothetical protein
METISKLERAKKKLSPAEIRTLFADLAEPFVPGLGATRQAMSGNYGQAAVSGLLDFGGPIGKAAGLAALPMMGMIRKVAPQDEALKIAQENAVKMLGLPPGNTPMDRARAMGMIDAYHGTNEVIESGFDLTKAGAKTGNPTTALGTSVATFPSEASRYTSDFGTKQNANVMPLMVRYGNTYQMPYSELDDLAMGLFRAPGNTPSERRASAKKIAGKRRDELVAKGYDSIRAFSGTGHEETFIPDPSRIRSRFAAFDPARINENDLLASLAALGIGLPVASGLLNQESY